jgi:8-oxo-dGTP diphosphatase
MTSFPCARCGRPVRRNLRARPPRIACPRCRYLLYDYPRPCAGVVVVKGPEVLMLVRGQAPRRGWLDLPGGFVEAGEDLEAAARRELREETGLEVGRLAWFGFYWDRYWLRGFGRFPTMNFYWLARWRSGEPRGADDAAEARWMTLDLARRQRHRFAWPHMAEVFRDLVRDPAVTRAGRGRRPVRG